MKIPKEMLTPIASMKTFMDSMAEAFSTRTDEPGKGIARSFEVSSRTLVLLSAMIEESLAAPSPGANDVHMARALDAAYRLSNFSTTGMLVEEIERDAHFIINALHAMKTIPATPDRPKGGGWTLYEHEHSPGTFYVDDDGQKSLGPMDRQLADQVMAELNAAPSAPPDAALAEIHTRLSQGMKISAIDAANFTLTNDKIQGLLFEGSASPDAPMKITHNEQLATLCCQSAVCFEVDALTVEQEDPKCVGVAGNRSIAAGLREAGRRLRLTPPDAPMMLTRNDDGYWLHLTAPDGKMASFNIQPPRGPLTLGVINAVAIDQTTHPVPPLVPEVTEMAPKHPPQ